MSFASRFVVVAAVAPIALISAPPVSGHPAREPRPGEAVTVAGVEGRWGFAGDGGDATQALLGSVAGVAVAADGTVYVADENNQAVRVVTADGMINPLPVPEDPYGSSTPTAVAMDGSGMLYVATSAAVQRRNPDGTFAVVAGGGDKSFDGGGDGGDGGPATDVRLGGVTDLAVGPDGSLYVAEVYYDRIRRVSPDGTISTVAGGSVLDKPEQVAVDLSGTVYFTQTEFQGVRKVAADGSISMVLGQRAEPGFSGDGGPAAEARSGEVRGLATDPEGNLYLADLGNKVIRVIDPQGVIDTVGPAVPALSDVTVGPAGDLYLTGHGTIKRLVRGTAEASAGGDGLRPGPARWTDQEPGSVLPVVGAGRERTSVEGPVSGSGAMAAGPDGTVYYADYDRVVALRPDGTREVYVGSGLGHSGDGGPAVQADLSSPEALAVDQGGNLYIADTGNHHIHKVDTEGTITTVAGNGSDRSILDEGPNGDGGPATEAPMTPVHLAAGPDGSLYLVDGHSNGRIRKIDPRGIITSIAEVESAADTAETPAEVIVGDRKASSLAVDQGGNVYFTYDGQVHRVSPGGELSPVTGADAGFAGDGGPAARALLNEARGLAVGPDGTLYITDSLNNLVRAVRPEGIITTVAGNRERQDSGDDGPATDAALHEPAVVATDGAGNVYVTTADTARIRRIDPSGTITTVAELGLVVDGVAATDVVIESPAAVAVDPAGTVFVAGDDPIIAASADDKTRSVAPLVNVNALATGPDGSVYVPHEGRVDRLYPDGATVTVAGGVRLQGNEPLPDADGKRATSSVLDPGDVAISPAGELYLTSRSRVYRVDRDGMLRSVLDLKDIEGFEDPEAADLAIAVGHDGQVYVADMWGDRVYAMSGEGEVRPFAGNGEKATVDDRGDGAEATGAPVSSPKDLAVAPDGTVYLATEDGVRQVSTDGEIDTVAELRERKNATAVALDVHGNLYVTMQDLHQVFVVVRPGELAEPFPWGLVWWSLGAAVLLAVVVAVVVVRVRRHRRLRQLGEEKAVE